MSSETSSDGGDRFPVEVNGHSVDRASEDRAAAVLTGPLKRDPEACFICSRCQHARYPPETVPDAVAWVREKFGDVECGKDRRRKDADSL